MSLPHACQRCGASCQGLRVRVGPDERARLATHAEQLGIDHPFSGPWIRQSWGTCVFYDRGCRLHAELGVEAKPAVCRTFPRLAAAIDPACFHPGVPTGPRIHVDWEDLEPGRATRTLLDDLPLAAVLDGPDLGPLTRQALLPLVSAAPKIIATVERPGLERHLSTVVRHALVPQQDPVRAVVGGLQLGGRGVLAPWIRLLKRGLFGRIP